MNGVGDIKSLAPKKSPNILPIFESIDEGAIVASQVATPSPAQARIRNIYSVRPDAFGRAAIEPGNNANGRGLLPQGPSHWGDTISLTSPQLRPLLPRGGSPLIDHVSKCWRCWLISKAGASRSTPRDIGPWTLRLRLLCSSCLSLGAEQRPRVKTSETEIRRARP
jgi:hypothetical protein